MNNYNSGMDMSKENDIFNMAIFWGILLTIITIPIMVLPSIKMQTYTIKTAISYILIYTMLVTWVCKIVKIKRVEISISSIYIPMSLFALLCIISTFYSKYKYTSIEELLRYISYFTLVFLMSNHLQDAKSIKNVRNTIIIVGGTVSLYGLLQYLKLDILKYPPHDRIFSTLGNPDFLGAYLVTILPLAVVSFLDASEDEQGVRRWILYFPILLMCICLFLTKTRGAIISCGVTLIFMSIFIAIFVDRKILTNKTTLTFVIITITCLTIIVLQDKEIVKRVLTSFDVRENGHNSNRITFWKGALNMFIHNPVFGVGLGNFQIYFPLYRVSNYSQYGVSHNTTHAHNEYLELMCELGLIGLVIFIAIFFVYFKNVVHFIKNKDDRGCKLLLIGCMSGVIGLLVQNFVCVSLRWTECAVPFWAIIGLTIAITNSEKKTSAYLIGQLGLKRISFKPILYLLPIISVIIIGWFSVKPILSNAHLTKARFYMEKMGQSKAAIYECRKAIKLDKYNLSAYWEIIIIYLIGENYDKALETGKRLTELAPNYATIHHLLGVAYYRTNQQKDAIIELEKAIQFNSCYPELPKLLAEIYIKTGKNEKALGLLNQALHLDPTDTESWFKLGLIYEHQSNYDNAIQMYEEILNVSKGEITAYLRLGRCYRNKGLFSKSAAIYVKAIEYNPKDWRPYNNLGILHIQFGKDKEALSFFEKALALIDRNNDESIAIHFNLANCYLKQGDLYDAYHEFLRVVELNPEHDLAEIAKMRLKEIKQR